MTTSIIVCTHNRADDLAEMLDSLAQVRLPEGESCELIIVDNNSTDETPRVVERFSESLDLPVRYLFEERQGKSYALNAGIAASAGEILLFTDDDVLFDEAWIEASVRPFRKPDGKTVAGVGGRIIPDWESPPPDWYRVTGRDRLMAVIVSFDHGDEERELDTPPFGANMAFRREVFERHGLFREDLGPGAGQVLRGEDTEFARRLLRAGDRIVYAPNAVVYHPVDPARATKEYFRSWYWDYGKAEARLRGPESDATTWFGVPRHLFRTLASQVFGWLGQTDARRRFVRDLEVRRTLGNIVESHHLSKS